MVLLRGANRTSRQVAVLPFPDNALLLLSILVAGVFVVVTDLTFITAVDATFVAAFVVAFVATFLLAPCSPSIAVLCGSAGDGGNVGEMALFIDCPFLAIKSTSIADPYFLKADPDPTSEVKADPDPDPTF